MSMEKINSKGLWSVLKATSNSKQCLKVSIQGYTSGIILLYVLTLHFLTVGITSPFKKKKKLWKTEPISKTHLNSLS